MSLDIHTARGQESLQHEREVQNYIKEKWKLDIIETPKDTSAKCDGFLTKESNLVAVFETKCRYDMNYSKLLERGSWLITYEKVLACRKLSEYLQVPFLAFLYLLPKNSNEKILLYWKLTDNTGKFLFEFDVQEEQTQKTINGGLIMRKNAYLPVEKALFFK